MAIEFNEQQIYALYDIEKWWHHSTKQVYELSGAAGTGKTTLIKYFIERMNIPLNRVAFVAYMGKASMQMARNGLPAQTIHSLIYEYKKVPETDENGEYVFRKNGRPKMTMGFVLREKLEKDIDLIVVDEGSTVDEKTGKDILSFGIPVIVLGDLNQLPPVYGKPIFLTNPDYILTQVMRQEEGNPIVWLAHRVLDGESLPLGVYGKSSVIGKADLNNYILKEADVVLTASNKLRNEINTMFREQITPVRKLDAPNLGEKIICRRNNWKKSIDDVIYLTNGTVGTVTYVDIESFDGDKIKIDFKPDFLQKKFKNLFIDYKRMFGNPGGKQEMKKGPRKVDEFEFAYAITTHLSQGSQYNNVVFLNERTHFDKETYKKLQYTAITRAIDKITIVN